jgi:sugar phosphate isomerase/epimerase
MAASIGCNIVHPECDRGDMYTRPVYLERLDAYRGYGFSHIEFSHVTVIDEADAEVIRRRAEELGLVLWSIHSEHLNTPGPQGLADYLKVQTHCARVARELGTPAYVCHVPNLQPYAADVPRDVEILNRLADITDAHGLRLAIETGPKTSYVIELADRIGRPTVGINLDSGHTFLLGEDPAQAARQIGRRLFTTHLQDNFGRNDDHQAPGMGKIEWRPLLRAIRDTGYTGPFMVELTGRGVAANRTAEELRDFPLEKEIIFTLAYLGMLAAEMSQGR